MKKLVSLSEYIKTTTTNEENSACRRLLRDDTSRPGESDAQSEDQRWPHGQCGGMLREHIQDQGVSEEGFHRVPDGALRAHQDRLE